MTENFSPVEVVQALVQVISSQLPRLSVQAYLDPEVIIHMDAITYRGITNWYKWIHLIRNCGRIRDLLMTPSEVRNDPLNPQLVHLSFRWSGIDGRTSVPGAVFEPGHIRYLVANGRIVEIWTRKTNYVPIFGRWIRFSFCYRLFLGWAILYFALLALRGIDFRVDRI